MAFHSKKDFAAMCGMASNKLAIYINRGKVRLSGQFVDDSIQENIYFLEKHSGKKTSPIPPNIEQPKVIKLKEPKIEESTDDRLTGYELDKKLKETKIEKTEEEITLLKIRKEKLMGEVIPTELVKSIFVQHSQSIITEFKNCIDDIVTTFAKTRDLNTNEIAEIRGGLVKNINISVDKAVALTKKNINNIVKEFTVKREVGERT